MVIALFLLSIGLLMAIATANVSNLALSRSLSRIASWRFAPRWAPGADGWCASSSPKDSCSRSRRRSSLPLALAGLRAIRRRPAEAVFRQLTIDVHELSFVALVTLICPLVFSIAPARLLSRPDMRQVLAASGGRGSTASTRGRGALVVLQVALAVILLTVSSLAVRAIRQIYTAPIGLDTANVMLLGLDFNEMSYPGERAVLRRGSQTRDRLAALPGVTTVAMVNALPILGDRMPVPLVLDTATGDANEVNPTAVVTSASPAAPAALGVNLLAGSWWSAGDTMSRSSAAPQRNGTWAGSRRRSGAGSRLPTTTRRSPFASSACRPTLPIPIARRRRRRACGCL